ncbi:TonB-dependent receptor [Uliginosibacterium paludis]|uniref:TonB-dependent receptor n=1 Tax=Uliginosibacterium paludis TaxID=1615952 RepID=A0ABV2CVK8_9RHOO
MAVAAACCVSQVVVARAEDDPAKLERVEVVGSNIKRAAAKQATQIEVHNTEEFTKQGLTTTQDVVNTLASNQSDIVAARTVGSDQGGAAFANLRGLGSQYTLVLIDGRRAANQPAGQSGYAVDLNAIPLEAIERVEVLKEGAAAIYGTDAIGGVINFITKKSYQGATVNLGYSSPTQSGGGTERRLAVAGGYGDLNDDGWNVMGTLAVSKTEALWAKDRADVAIDRNPSFSSNAFPANYLSSQGVRWSGTYPKCGTGTEASGKYCLQNTSNFIGILPETERMNASAKATKRFGEHEASLQFLHAETKTTSSVAPTPTAGAVSIGPSSPYYPKTNPDGTTNTGDLALYGRTVEAGNRVNEFNTSLDRLQSNFEGQLAGWDYRGGLGYSEAKLKETMKSGWISTDKMQAAIDNGTLNPFASNSASLWNSLALSGVLKKSTMKLTTADYKMSRELFDLPGGAAAVGFGTEARREQLDAKVNTSLATQAMSSGSEDSKPTAGSRNVYAFYGEAILPVLKSLEVQTAVRYDHYSDFGDTINPKAAFKFTPVEQVMFRGSASTGFRAPSLYDMYMPASKTNTGTKYSDPLLCPDGKNPVAGASAGACVADQRDIQQGGNTKLKPEKTWSTSIGMVVEPVKAVTLSADLWTTAIKDRIGTLDESVIMGDPVKYRSRFVTKSNGSLDYITALSENLGKMRASGVDLGATWRLPRTAVGNFSVDVNSTYMKKYDYQNEKDGEWTHNVGRYGDDYVIFRWKTNVDLNWKKDAWGAVIGTTYKSSYNDMYTNDDDSNHHVASQLLWNGSLSYNWNKTLDVTFGAKNIFNRKPPYSNQNNQFQTGYDPRYADVVGRVLFLNLSYKM